MRKEQADKSIKSSSNNSGLLKELQGLDGYEENIRLQNEKLSNYASFLNGGDGDFRLSQARNSYYEDDKENQYTGSYVNPSYKEGIHGSFKDGV